MNPRVSRSSRARVEGDRLPDREDRRAAGGRLRARGDRQRHHQAHARPASSRRSTTSSSSGRGSRSRSSPAPTASCRPTCSRSARRWRSAARSSRRSSRRCARASSTSQAEPPEDTEELLERLEIAVARPLRAAVRGVRARRRRGRELHRRTGIDPWYLAEIERDRARRRPGGGPRPHVQGGRHLRRRVRGRDAVLLLGLGAPRPGRAPRHEVEPRRPAERRDPRLGPEPDRPGHRVRLLLRARGDDRARVGPRRGDDQLQPGDGLDRLRHVRPALLRAAHARGRARGDRGRAARGRDRLVRRPDAAAARARPGRGRRAAARHAGRLDRPGRGPRPLPGRCCASSACRAPPFATADRPEEALERPPATSATRCSSARRTCSAAARWRSATTTTACATTCAAPARAPGSEIYLDRFLENAIEIDVDALCDGETVHIGAIMQHVEEAGVHSGDSACVIPAMSLGPEMLAPRRGGDRAARARARRRRADQHPVRRRRRRPVRDRGQPARVAHGAVRVEGGRRPAGQAGDARDARRAARRHGRRPGRRAASPSTCRSRRPCCPFGRFPLADSRARPGDEVDRRGDGRRERLSRRVRQGAGGGGRRAARQRHGVHLGDRRRQAGRHPARGGAARPRLRDPRDRRHGVRDPPDGRPGRADPQDLRGLAQRRRPDRVRRRRPRDQHADRLRRARRRLGDPPRRRRAAASRASRR